MIAVAVVLALAFAGFMALGVWQLQRLAWKTDLIARVDTRVHAEPQAPPPPSEWADINANTHEYLRVRLAGMYLEDLDTRVQALTELGSGYWILTPLQLATGETVLVNRGFVPQDWPGEPVPGGAVNAVGLLRLSEPGGGFLRSNDPAAERWYSRDVAAIARARGLSEVAPYFVDLEAGMAASAPAWPRAGLTVIEFRNTHLVYALTWFALALLVVWAGWKFTGERSKLAARSSASP